MAFVKGTKVFTDSGWKCIEDISGQDKLLVRNFIGHAEFIQPFALKKRQYDGEIVEIGAQYWNFSVTPDHIIVYDKSDVPTGANMTYEEAGSLTPNKYNRIYRKFKFLPYEDYEKERIYIYSEFGKVSSTISNEDWFVLCGFVLCRANLYKSNKKRGLRIYLNEEQLESELSLLSDILDRIGVEWSFIEKIPGIRPFVRVSLKNTLAGRIITRLGTYKRKEMHLPDKMIYQSSKELAKLLIDTIKWLSKRPETDASELYQLTTNNEKLVKSLLLLGTIWGYGMHSSIMAKKGTKTSKGVLTKDVLRLTIRNLAETYTPTTIEKNNYNGYVYGIELFDGQVYVKSGSIALWVNPK